MGINGRAYVVRSGSGEGATIGRKVSLVSSRRLDPMFLLSKRMTGRFLEVSSDAVFWVVWE